MPLPEFTCQCQKTGQPDFAMLYLEYVADKKCVELKSLKLYMWSFRDEGHFREDVTNRILDDLVKATRPRFMRLSAVFNVRGRVYTQVVREHMAKGWKDTLPPAAWRVGDSAITAAGRGPADIAATACLPGSIV